MTASAAVRWAFLIASAAAAAGCSRDPGKCCDEFSATDENGIYCIAHKDAVVRYVSGGKTPEERKKRLEWFKGVVKELEPLTDSDQVHDRLSRYEESHPEFWVVYDKQPGGAGEEHRRPQPDDRRPHGRHPAQARP